MKVKCDQPGCQFVADHKIPGQAKRMVGSHKMAVHGIRGITSTPEGRKLAARMGYYRKIALPQAEIDRREARRAAQPQQETPDKPTRKPKTSDAEPMALTYCPACGIRFWLTKGQT